VGIVALSVLVFMSEPGFVFILDHANLLFHEAGHPVAGVFSQRMEVYGGTLGQLTFPLVFRQRQLFFPSDDHYNSPRQDELFAW
jgi:p-aminobenzoyl-glutamate transporter AbgT